MRKEEMFREMRITRWNGAQSATDLDRIVVEEPLEIRLNGQSLAVTMRTPGQDHPLAAGFLLTEGIIRSKEDIWDIQHCASPESPDSLNIIEVTVPPDRLPNDLQAGRQRYANSSCGICGKATLEAVRRTHPAIVECPMIPAAFFHLLPDRLRSEQRTFLHTGGLHAAGIFNVEGELLF